MSKKKKSESSMSTQSAKRKTRNDQPKQLEREILLIEQGPEEIVSSHSSSRLADLYKTDEFANDWANQVSFHVAMNLLHLRRHRGLSQEKLAELAKTSQSAIARIESDAGNITLDT